jgi:hypothetical protein
MSLEMETGNPVEVEKVEEVIEQPKSMDDTIRETLRELQSKGVEVEKDMPVSDEEKAKVIRDEKGKFKAEIPVVGKQAEEIKPEVVVKAAPNTWKKEVADKWSTLPAEVQSEVERREADFHKGIEQYKGKAQFGESIERAIQPYASTLQALNITPDKAIAELMAADHRLRYGSPAEKQAYFSQLAQNYGVSLGEVANQPQVDPNVNYLTQQVNQLQGWIQNQTLMGQQKEQESLTSEIAQFASDPSHSHFESVKGYMSALLQAGQAQNLTDAYEQAIYANPQTRALILAEQQAKERNEITLKAQAAKNAASINVRNRPSMPVSQPIGTMDDTIRSTLRRLQNG